MKHLIVGFSSLHLDWGGRTVVEFFGLAFSARTISAVASDHHNDFSCRSSPRISSRHRICSAEEVLKAWLSLQSPPGRGQMSKSADSQADPEIAGTTVAETVKGWAVDPALYSKLAALTRADQNWVVKPILPEHAAPECYTVNDVERVLREQLERLESTNREGR